LEKYKNAYSLNLSKCHNVRDVNMLGNVHTLDLAVATVLAM
jgi:hypothetical protein